MKKIAQATVPRSELGEMPFDILLFIFLKIIKNHLTKFKICCIFAVSNQSLT